MFNLKKQLSNYNFTDKLEFLEIIAILLPKCGNFKFFSFKDNVDRYERNVLLNSKNNINF
jgi:hypothetical protein